MEERKPLVLVADDEQNAVTLLTHIFERDGFEVENARDGESALEKARALRPDLILMDVQMPKMDGFKVVEQLREDPATARVPIIFVTAAAREPADVAHGLKLGADDYIRKPYNYHELLARARSKMHARQLEDRLQRRNEQLEALVRIGADSNKHLGLTNCSICCWRCPVRNWAEAVELFLLDEKRRLLHCQEHQAPPAADLNAAEARLKQPKTVAGQVYASGEPLLIADTTQASDKPTDLESSHLRSAIAVPFRHQGKLMGILIAAHSSPNRFSDTDLRLLRSIGEQAALAARNAQLHAELQRHAQNWKACRGPHARAARRPGSVGPHGEAGRTRTAGRRHRARGQ